MSRRVHSTLTNAPSQLISVRSELTLTRRITAVPTPACATQGNVDDIVLMGDDPSALELSLKFLTNAARSIRLEIHPGKTKWMKNTFTRDYCLCKEGSVIEEVYLGQAITMDNDLSIEIGRRHRAGWATFNKYRDVLTDRWLDARTKEVFNTHVVPALVYGSETWSTIKNEGRKLASTQRAMERAVCAVTLMHKIPASEIRKRTCVKDVMTQRNDGQDTLLVLTITVGRSE
ncbi:hypothetical protein TELCIR_07046 [Teladorsagia circumcincta]|uniref:Reverse transcriptase domain-containing protein n=1 Tax=Teladorsagia circumcincta TaxID=45464 RepID=A0A2G9ULC0_TELCI|nr:hypothetical protein TELCIR_07046 [Teladorsagia circumcincta]